MMPTFWPDSQPGLTTEQDATAAAIQQPLTRRAAPPDA